MRCPSCGTENEKDSRFCGGCGGRMQPSTVAPTQKISGDAPYPAPALRPHTPQHASIPPQNVGPASIPPQNVGPASIPPQNVGALASPVPRTRPPGLSHEPPAPGARPMPPSGRLAAPRHDSDPGMSIPAGRTRWGLILTLLVIDLALAATGVWLLRAGLAT